MKHCALFACLFAFLPAVGNAQDEPRFTVEVNSDTVGLGNYLEVTFTLENTQGNHFTAPDFEGFALVSGPNQSSSFSMINGAVTQSMSFTYYLEPRETGVMTIAAATIETKEGTLKSPSIDVVVVETYAVKPKTKAKKSFPGFSDEDEVRPQQEVQKPKKNRKVYKL